MFKGKTLLITGGTGSFGNAVLDKFLDSDIKELRIFSRDEKKQYDMRTKYKNKNITYYIGDIRSYDSIDEAMNGIDFIFHAAALKQVPTCEFFPMEAVKTNILGTDNLLRCAIKHKVKKVICLSTDKAAYPINAMGISKAMMEKVMVSHALNADPQKTVICATRYGNVMASRGSVIPLFINQIKQNQPLTITASSMSRYLISLDDAVDLVTFAFKNANPGDIFVQKAPASTIGNLAQALLEIFNSKCETNEIGIRSGEKQYETLLTSEEMARAENLGDYFRIESYNNNKQYDDYYIKGHNDNRFNMEYSSNNTKLLSIAEIKELLLSLEYIQDELNTYNRSFSHSTKGCV